MYTDAESLYLNRIDAAYSGCILGCNPYIKEYKDAYPSFNSSLSEIILAIPGIALNLGIFQLKIFYEFFLPALLFFLAYFLVFRLTRNKDWAIFGASFIVLGQNLFNSIDLINISDMIHLLQAKTEHNQFLILSRPVNPQFSLVYFFIYLHSLLSAVEKKNWKWWGSLAVLYGLSFYIYFFIYAFITVIQAVYIGIYLLKKEWRTLLYFALGTFVGLVIAIPHFIEIFNLFSHPYYSTIPTSYLIRSHIPDVSVIGMTLFLVFIAVSILYIQKFKVISVRAYYVFTLATACFIARNEHVMSGMIMQYDHFEVFLFGPIFVIACCFLIHSFFGQETSVKYRGLILLLSILPILNSTSIQYKSYQYWLPYAKSNQEYVSVLSWVRDNTSHNSVISAPPIISRLIPLYTHNYVLWSFYAGQWMSMPGRFEDIVSSRVSADHLQKIGRKYGVNYYIEERKSDIFESYKEEKIKVFEDARFVVYKAM